VESRKRDDQAAEWACLWFQLCEEDRAILRGLMLVKVCHAKDHCLRKTREFVFAHPQPHVIE
jgi:hypothetical protein